MKDKSQNMNNFCICALRYGTFVFIVFILLILHASTFSISYSSYLQDAVTLTKENQFKPVIQKLEKKGVSTDFIRRMIMEPQVKFDEKFVKINVTGYLKKPDYSHFYNEKSVNNTKAFIEDCSTTLNKAERKYSVPKEIIASILWIETKHGTYLGNSNIVSVFFSTAMADETEYIQSNKEEIRKDNNVKPEQYPELDKKIEERAKKKSEWAIKEIIALERLDKISRTPIQQISGSWAGAFGFSQFLPSSYISWAVDGNDDGYANLFEMDDAIFSVANYLKSNGWGIDYPAQRAAVFHYNNSEDYVNAVFTLANLAKS